MPRPRRNFYVILGISPDASAEDVRAAYRDLAKRFHPDRFGPSGAYRFKEITEAYQALSDPERRRAHNRELDIAEPSRPVGVEPLVSKGRVYSEPLVSEPVSLRRAFSVSRPSAEDEFLDWTAGHYSEARIPKSGRLEPLSLEVVLTQDEAEAGGILPIQVPAFLPCSFCGGSGRDWLYPCLSCSGAGVIQERATLRLRIPGMVCDGTLWEIPLLEAGLYLRVHIRVAPG